MLLEGQTRIPSGCAISGVISKSRKRMSGEAIIKSISVMHDRSNGLGGGFAAYYWESEREAEIDFVVQRNGHIIPIEVKSSDNMKSKSLSVYMQKFKPKYAIKLSTKNFGFENNIKTTPLYAVFCL